ncbi:hypothetical protein PTSG_11978 [Salpingoeca rosetta]|uniref:Uncharacterized protein n=1 Tax=Salpingoeca rosetta (strain ATCC 50818 / BSB-021) TaxID=946362 RepID=F2U4K0_SALR5|nr:uncharacterized protein PTSG_11978 [Salpingoeca rosetta]EGD82566.1 hypothetical protein PTSG_11978 [Salpingoeca rosetta]|eukprot:XP_004995802.1 hypothetical protein PTSG_11978 [Salpingoeca rosetta]
MSGEDNNNVTVTLGAPTWAEIAKHLLRPPSWQQDPFPVARYFDCDHEDTNLGPSTCVGVRGFFNLMLTCRGMYHDLPWAMPKWCLAEEAVPKAPPNRAPSTFSFQAHSEHWLDTFQVRLAPRQQEPLHVASDAVAFDEGAWLRQRFLVHSWLGMTWNSECVYLQRQVQAQAPAFWSDFARFGRIKFSSLPAMEAWTNRPHGSNERTQADTEAPATASTASAESTHSVSAPSSSADAGGGTPVQVQPALFSIKAVLGPMGSAERFMACRKQLAHVKGGTFELILWHRCRRLTIRDVRELQLFADGVHIKRVDFANIDDLYWFASAHNGCVEGKMTNIGRIHLEGGCDGYATLTDIAPLVDTPRVQIEEFQECRANMTPLCNARQLVLCQHVDEVSFLGNVHHVEWLHCMVEELSLNASRVALGNLEPDDDSVALHLPNATYIALKGCPGAVVLECPVRLQFLQLYGCTNAQLPTFEHAHVVDIDMELGVEALRDLGSRVDKLVLRDDAAKLVSQLGTIPVCVEVHGSAEDIGLADGVLPACVRRAVLTVHTNAFHVGLLAHVQQLTLQAGEGSRPAIQGLDELRNLKALRIVGCELSGTVSASEQVCFTDCSGSITVENAGTLYITDKRDATEKRESDATLMQVLSTRNVHVCRIVDCELETLCGFAGVHCLVLQCCTVADAETLPQVACLCLRGRCYRQPIVSLVGRAREDMIAVINSGQTDVSEDLQLLQDDKDINDDDILQDFEDEDDDDDDSDDDDDDDDDDD